MAKKSRDKGAAGEREAAKLLQGVFDLDHPPLRNLAQYQENGLADFVLTAGPDTFAIEVKRHSSFTTAALELYWVEACGQAVATQVPVLLYRPDRRPWTVRVPVFWLTAAAAVETLEAHWADLTPETLRAILRPSLPEGGLLR